MPQTQHAYGWQHELPDHRNIPLGLFEPRPSAVALPPRVDLTPQMPPVYDQLSLNSCTANAGVAMFRYVARKLGLNDQDLSRMFVWYEARKMHGWESLNTGSYISDVLALLASEGVPPEGDCPYIETNYATQPSQTAYGDAVAHEATVYLSVDQNLDAMRACLAAEYPFEFGFSLYENFESDETSRTGVVQMPQGALLGGHAVLAVGYDDASQRIIGRNSWNRSWGNLGNFTMPYAYLVDGHLASDFRTIRRVTSPIGPPVDRPTILTAIVKAAKNKIRIFGSWKPNATFYVGNTQAYGNDFGGGQFVAKHITTNAGDTLTVVNPDGISSLPFALVV